MPAGATNLTTSKLRREETCVSALESILLVNSSILDKNCIFVSVHEAEVNYLSENNYVSSEVGLENINYTSLSHM